MKKFNTLHFGFLLTTLLLQSCMPDSLTKFKKEETVKKTTASATTTTVSPSAPPDLTTLKTFQLRNITEKSTSYHLHKYGVGNSVVNCEINVSDLTDGQSALTDQTNDILCWLEADETQLFFNGTDLQVNAPAGYCEYIQVKPYYFWNAPPANTKKVVKTVSCSDPTSTNCVALGGPAAANLTCAGDYTSQGGPNCDEGYVQHNVYTVAADTPATVGPPATPFIVGAASVTTSTTACGGKRTNCYGGPGVDFKVNRYGYPVPLDYLAYGGQSINYSITAPGPLGKGFGSNHYISNFTQSFKADPLVSIYDYDYTIISGTTGLELFGLTSDTANYSYAALSSVHDTTSDANLNAAVDVGVDPLKSADAYQVKTTTSWATLATPNKYKVQPFYEFSCLNYAHEVKGRIRLQIREWNQNFQQPVASYTEVSEASPARMIKQSINITDYETSGVGYWNDVPAWDVPFDYGSSAAYVPAAGVYPMPLTNNGFLFPYLGF